MNEKRPAMRKFVCRGGKNDGQVINITHGKRVYVASTDENYVVLREPTENTDGVLVPDPENRPTP